MHIDIVNGYVEFVHCADAMYGERLSTYGDYKFHVQWKLFFTDSHTHKNQCHFCVCSFHTIICTQAEDENVYTEGPHPSSEGADILRATSCDDVAQSDVSMKHEGRTLAASVAESAVGFEPKEHSCSQTNTCQYLITSQVSFTSVGSSKQAQQWPAQMLTSHAELTHLLVILEWCFKWAIVV